MPPILHVEYYRSSTISSRMCVCVCVFVYAICTIGTRSLAENANLCKGRRAHLICTNRRTHNHLYIKTHPSTYQHHLSDAFCLFWVLTISIYKDISLSENNWIKYEIYIILKLSCIFLWLY